MEGPKTYAERVWWLHRRRRSAAERLELELVAAEARIERLESRLAFTTVLANGYALVLDSPTGWCAVPLVPSQCDLLWNAGVNYMDEAPAETLVALQEVL